MCVILCCVILGVCVCVILCLLSCVVLGVCYIVLPEVCVIMCCLRCVLYCVVLSCVVLLGVCYLRCEGGRWEEVCVCEVLAVSGKNKNPNLRSWGKTRTPTLGVGEQEPQP